MLINATQSCPLMPTLKVYFGLLGADIYFGVVGLNRISNIVHISSMLLGFNSNTRFRSVSDVADFRSML